MPALLHPVEVHRIPSYGKDVEKIFSTFKELEKAHFNTVPLHLTRLKAAFGTSFLDYIESGLVGGAAISAEQAEWLQGSSMRVGYGQTEASPGICVGEAGHFEKGILGKACGCQTRINEEDVLEFKGENAFLGYWKPKNGPNWNRSEWVTTGDRVFEGTDMSYRFLGRMDDRIKLQNGREIHPLSIEEEWTAKLPIKHTCLYSSDGVHLSAAFCLNDGISIKEFKLLFKEQFPHWVEKLHQLHFLTNQEWPQSPKGDTIRNIFSEEFNYVH
jgi:long-subunit acyl-CoA synthetase (AMP-forming)